MWSKVKELATCPASSVSYPAQQLIKTLVLHAHTFRRLRLSEAEAMALLDDETDRINFEERDRNAQYWLFKQLYHVLVQSSLAVIDQERKLETFIRYMAEWKGQHDVALFLVI